MSSQFYGKNKEIMILQFIDNDYLLKNYFFPMKQNLFLEYDLVSASILLQILLRKCSQLIGLVPSVYYFVTERWQYV